MNNKRFARYWRENDKKFYKLGDIVDNRILMLSSNDEISLVDHEGIDDIRYNIQIKDPINKIPPFLLNKYMFVYGTVEDRWIAVYENADIITIGYIYDGYKNHVSSEGEIGDESFEHIYYILSTPHTDLPHGVGKYDYSEIEEYKKMLPNEEWYNRDYIKNIPNNFSKSWVKEFSIFEYPELFKLIVHYIS